MKIILLLTAVTGICIAAPPDATIIRYDSENIGVDGYKFNVETSDGLNRVEQGVILNPGTENEILRVTGTVKWVDLDGTPHQLEFVADDNGYQPVIRNKA